MTPAAVPRTSCDDTSLPCDDTSAAVVRRPRGALVDRLVAERAARAVRRRGARGRLAPPHGARQRRRGRGDGRAPASAGTTSPASPSRRARASSAPCSWAWRRPRPSPTAAACRSCRSTTCRATSPPTTRSASRRRSSASSPAAGTPCSPSSRRASSSASRRARSTTPPARPSTRAPGCWGCATRAAGSSTRWPRAATRRFVRLSARRAARPRLQLQRPQDGAALRPARPRRGGGRGAPRRHRRLLPGGDRRPARRQDACAAPAAEGLRRVAIAGGVAANSRPAPRPHGALRAARPAASLPPLSLCTDNAGMIGLAAGFLPAVPWPRLPRPRRLRQRQRGPGGAAAPARPRR